MVTPWLAAFVSMAVCSCVGMEAGTSAPQTTCAQPLKSVPEGWVVIPQVGVDSAAGGYHDAVSGALVGFDGIVKGSLQAAANQAPDERDGTLHGIPYHLEVIPNVRDQLIERRRHTFGSDYPERVPDAEEFLPLPGARRLVVAFGAPAVAWRFTADVYDETQEGRVRQLLLGASAVCPELPELKENTGKGSIDSPRYSQVGEGDSVRQVLQSLGIPYLVRPSGRTGFVLRYDLEDKGRTLPVDLYFSQEQRLLRKMTRGQP